MSRRSISQLKSWTRCSEAFYLERIVRPRLPARPAAWTALGTALHKTFEDWEHSGRQIDCVTNFEVYYDAEIDDYFSRQPDRSLWFMRPITKNLQLDIDYHRERGITVDIPNYLRYCEEAGWEVARMPDGHLALEVEFEYVFEGPTEDDDIVVPGAIDKIVLYPDERLTITDLKSGSEEPDDWRQLAWYGFVARTKLGMDVRWAQYFYTKGGKTKEGKAGDWIDTLKLDENFWRNQFRRLDTSIDRRLWLPSPGKNCGLCSVRDYCSLLGTKDPEAQ